MKQFVLGIGALAVLLGLGACGEAAPEAPPTVIGFWKYESGTMWGSGGARTLTYLALSEDGTGEALMVAPESNVLTCMKLTYTQASDTSLLLDVPDLRYTDHSFLLSMKLSADGEMTLLDAQGGATRFTRATAVPASARCEAVSQVEVVSDVLDPRPGYFGLAPMGNGLLYTDDNRDLFRLDLGSGAVSVWSMSSFSGYGVITAVQGEDVWVTCYCGGSNEIQRRSISDLLVDEVSDDELGMSGLSFRSAAWEAGHLWIVGREQASGKNLLLKIDSEAEPDLLVARYELPPAFTNLVFIGGASWLRSENALVELDLETLKAKRTINLPGDARWDAMTVGPDGGLYILRVDREGQEYRVAKLTLPAAP